MDYKYNEPLDRIGRIDEDGTVYDASGKSMAKIHNSGFIYKLSDDGSAIILGRIDKDGTIRNPGGDVIGRIDANGYISINSRIVGRSANFQNTQPPKGGDDTSFSPVSGHEQEKESSKTKMTLEEANSLAESGKVEAMQALGEYYLKDNKYTTAWEWFSKAADKGFTPSVVHAALVGSVISLAQMKALGVNEEAIEPWEKTYYYSKKALESEDVPQNTKQTIQEKLPMVLFYLGYCLFYNNEIDKAISFLSQQSALADPACRVVLGLCYVDKATNNESGQEMARALPLLKEVDTAGVEEDFIEGIL